MQLTTEHVRAVLDKDEPDYGLAARLGPDALPHLAYLVEAGDPGLASKATYLAGFIDADQSVAVIERAAISPERVVRVAAAGSLSYLTEVPSALAVDLLSDPDAGVRYQALRAV